MTRLVELDGLWRRGAVPAVAVYETLRDVVLPSARPAEVFLYAAPLAVVEKNPASVRTVPPRPQNVGALLVHWAVTAGRSDELRKRLAERQSRPASELSVLVLLSLLAQAEGTPEAVAPALDAIGRKLEKDSLQASAELACHAALPALDAAHEASARAAVAVIERAAGSGGGHRRGTGRHPAHHARSVRLRARRRHRGAEADRSSTRHRGACHEPHSRRRPALPPQAGLRGRRLRVPQSRPSGRGPRSARSARRCAAGTRGRPLAGHHLVRARRPRSRPERDRARSAPQILALPAPGRRTVRLLAGFVPESKFSQVFREVADTASLLIAAARDAGKLDALAAELGPLDSQGVENARALRILVEAARGQGAAVESLAQSIAADLRRKGPGRTAVNAPLAVSGGAMPPAWPDILVARACLAVPALRSVGDAMASDLIAHAEQAQATDFKALLVREFAAAREPTP